MIENHVEYKIYNTTPLGSEYEQYTVYKHEYALCKCCNMRSNQKDTFMAHFRDKKLADQYIDYIQGLGYHA